MNLLPKSRTYRQLRALLAFLPSERLSQLKWVVAASIIPGFVDLASVAVIARLVGALVGVPMGDNLPGVKVLAAIR